MSGVYVGEGKMAKLKAGVYSITVSGVGTYYGESVNIKVRWAQHRKKLYSGRHHCVRLRAAMREWGMDVFEFKILAQSELLEKSVAARTSLEQAYIKADVNALNTKHNDSIITPSHMPSRPVYKNKQIRLARIGTKNWCKVYDTGGHLLGIEPLSEKFRLGTFVTNVYELVRVK
jgi:hypothetical protein